MNMRHHGQGGYLLIEAMIAMGILVTGVLSVFVLMSQSIKLNKMISTQYTANYLAAEGIEITKNILDNNNLTNSLNWNGGGFDAERCYELDYTTQSLSAATIVSCPDGGATPLSSDGTFYRYGGGVNTIPFTRTIHITPIMSGSATQIGVIVDSTVRWPASFGRNSITLEDTFYAWH